MKTIVHFSFILLAAVAPGTAKFFGSRIHMAIGDCYTKTDNFLNTICPNFPERVACLERIKPVNDEEKKYLSDSVAIVKDLQNACPGLESKQSCMFLETRKCMNYIQEREFKTEMATCNDVPRATDCMVKLRETCTKDPDIVQPEIDQLRKLSNTCTRKNYNFGTCNTSQLQGCIYNMFLISNDPRVKERVFPRHLCTTEIVVNAKKCLTEMKKNCPEGDKIQAEVDDKLEYLNDMCPTQ